MTEVEYYFDEDKEVFVDEEGNEFDSDNLEDSEIEWLDGSQNELERLVKIILYNYPKIFTDFNELLITFNSIDDEGGFNWDRFVEDNWFNSKDKKVDWDYSELKQMRNLLNLAFEYNYFSGFQWEYNDGAYNNPDSYDTHACQVRVKVASPNNHEIIEVKLLLEEWLNSVLPKQEIERILE